MNVMRIFGKVLVIIGMIMITITGIKLVTSGKAEGTEKQVEQSQSVRYFPLIGGLLLISGFVVLRSEKKRII
jgi:uncharacterized membrane protein